MNLIQQISHLGVFLETLARCGDDDKPSLRIGLYDLLDFAELGGVRYRCSSKFGDDNALAHIESSDSVLSDRVNYPKV